MSLIHTILLALIGSLIFCHMKAQYIPNYVPLTFLEQCNPRPTVDDLHTLILLGKTINEHNESSSKRDCDINLDKLISQLINALIYTTTQAVNIATKNSGTSNQHSSGSNSQGSTTGNGQTNSQGSGANGNNGQGQNSGNSGGGGLLGNGAGNSGLLTLQLLGPDGDVVLDVNGHKILGLNLGLANSGNGSGNSTSSGGNSGLLNTGGLLSNVL